MAKDATDHLSDFWEGVKSLPKGLYNFGDYMARISGLRDWQEQKDSVMYDGVTIYIEQSKAKQETKFLFEAFKEYELLPMYIDALKNDAKDRPAYYVGSLATSFAIGSVLASTPGAFTLGGMKAAGLSSDAMHSVMEELRVQLGASEEEFFKMLENDTLQDKIAQNIKECFDQVVCKDGVISVINKKGQGYKIEDGEWKGLDNNKEKLLKLDKSDNCPIDKNIQNTSTDDQSAKKDIQSNTEKTYNRKTLAQLCAGFNAYKEERREMNIAKGLDCGIGRA